MNTRAPTATKSIGKVGVRERSAEMTRANILRAAIAIFAKHGLDGGSIDQISTAANSHDRMIYYYFGNKEGLFVAALEETYRRFNTAEAALKLDYALPLVALQKVVQFIVQYYKKNPEFVI